MNPDKLLQWSKTAYKLNLKYKKQKYKYFKNFRKACLKKTNLDESRVQLIDLVEKNQLVLFNNIVNYSGLATGMIDDGEIKSQISVFMNISNKIRQIIQSEVHLLHLVNAENSQSYLPKIYSHYEMELKFQEDLKNQSEFIKGKTNILIRKFISAYESVKYSELELFQFIQSHRNAFHALEGTCLAASAVCLMAGIDTGDILTNIRRVAQMFG